MTASPEKLSQWIAREAGTKEPVHIAQGKESSVQSLLSPLSLPVPPYRLYELSPCGKRPS